jgi:hypothetical protein
LSSSSPAVCIAARSGAAPCCTSMLHIG